MDSGSKQAQVSAQLVALGKANEVLLETATNLEDRISAVLRGEDNIKDAMTPREELVPLAQSIRDQVDMVERNTDRLRGIIRRVEL